MKKTYISPETLTVVLNAKTNILQGSPLDKETTELPDDAPLLTKESQGDGGKNVWDEEW